VHPVAGQGLNLSLRDMAQLADLVAEAADLSPALWKTFVDRQRRDQARTIGITDSFVKIFSNDHKSFRLGRNVALRMLERMPPAKTALNRRMIGVAGRLSTLQRGVKPKEPEI